jgi:hypothetical protein
MVELAPAILPARLDLGHVRIREGGRDALPGSAERGELDRSRQLALLETVRCELDEPRPQLLGAVGGDGDRGADQWK